MAIAAALITGGGSSVSDPVSASVFPTLAQGSISGWGTGTTTAVTVTAIGGTPPYTYAWSFVSGDADFSTTHGTSATTAFVVTVDGYNTLYQATWKCTVTDALSFTTEVNVAVRFIENSYN